MKMGEMKISESELLSGMAEGLDEATLDVEACVRRFGYFVSDRDLETAQALKEEIRHAHNSLNMTVQHLNELMDEGAEKEIKEKW